MLNLTLEEQIKAIKSLPGPLISVDIDGVMIDYHQSFKKKWEKYKQVFIQRETKPGSYYAHTRYGIEMPPKGEERDKFHDHDDKEFWTTMQPIPGALEACKFLEETGATLFSVSAAPHHVRDWRLQNLIGLGFPILWLFMAPHEDEQGPISGKSKILNEIKPMMHIDDYLPYFDGMDPSIKRILLDTHPNCPESPNNGPLREQCHGIYSSLGDFVKKRGW